MKKYLSIILCLVIMLSVFTVSANAQDVPTYYYGDSNKNGVIDILDVSVIQKHIANFEGYDFDEIQLTISDVNGNGEVDVNDVTLIQKYLSFEILTFPDVTPTNPESTNTIPSTAPTEPYGTNPTASTEPTESVSTQPTESVPSSTGATETAETNTVQTTVTVTTKPTTQTIPTQPSECLDMKAHIENRINEARKNANLGYYHISDALSNCAYGRSLEIVDNVSNTRPDGRKWYTILTDYYKLNPDDYYLSEHIVTLDTKNNSYNQEEIADILVDALLKSQKDRDILLEENKEAAGKFRNMGVGINKSGNVYYLIIHLAG